MNYGIYGTIIFALCYYKRETQKFLEEAELHNLDDVVSRYKEILDDIEKALYWVKMIRE